MEIVQVARRKADIATATSNGDAAEAWPGDGGDLCDDRYDGGSYYCDIPL